METWNTHERQADKTVAKPKQSTVEKAALYCQLIMGGEDLILLILVSIGIFWDTLYKKTKRDDQGKQRSCCPITVRG